MTARIAARSLSNCRQPVGQASQNSCIGLHVVPTFTLEQVAYRLLPRVDAGRALADVEWRTLVNVAEVLLEGSPLSLSPEDAANGVERFLSAGQSRKAWRCRVLLTLIEHATVVTHRRCFARLSRAERRQLVEQRFVGGAGIWGLCAKVRYLVLMGAYGHPDAAAATGFVPMEQRDRFGKRDMLEASSVLQIRLGRASEPKLKSDQRALEREQSVA
jgi:hypothetical protein